MITVRKFIARLTSRPPISWHVELISLFAAELNPGTYAEIGIYEGETFNRVKAPHKIAVDIVESALGFIPQQEGVHKILGDARVFEEYLKMNQIQVDLLFIDADHAASSVVQDFSVCEKYMSDQGVILLHDTFPGTEAFSSPAFCGDAYKAIPILREKFPHWTFVTLPIHPGLTIATKIACLPTWVS